MIEVVRIKPPRQSSKPKELIKPSLSSKPKPTTKIPIAGKVFVPGMGIIMEIAIKLTAIAKTNRPEG